jgi:hypothetical protein
VRDEEAAEDEEGEDTESGGDGLVAAVVDDDDGSADGAEEIEAWNTSARTQRAFGKVNPRQTGCLNGGRSRFHRFRVWL